MTDIVPSGVLLPEEQAVQQMERARAALTEAKTFSEVRTIHAAVETVQAWLKRQQECSLAIANDAALLRLDAEARLGELLSDPAVVKRTDGRKPSHPVTVSVPCPPPTHRELGVNRETARRYREVATIPAEVRKKIAAEATERGEDLNRARLLKLARKETRPETPPPPPLPVEVFNLIYADPPWQTDFERGDTRDVEKHYPTMPLEAIKALSVPKLAAKDCTLFLWATSPMLPQGLEILKAWGFTYKSSAIWAKSGRGMGYYFRQDHELLLIGTKGSPGVPAPADRLSSVVSAEKGRHSEKPAAFYELIERMYPQAKRLELFARQGERDGWTFWGNEVGAKADLPADGLPQRGVGTGSGRVETDCPGAGTGGERGSSGGDREENLALCFG